MLSLQTSVCSTLKFYPVFLGDKKVNIETDVVPDDLPLLLSMQLMKTARTTIDFVNDKVTIRY